MNIAYNEPEGGQPITEVFNEEEIKVLIHLNKTLQGKTHKTQNHNNLTKHKVDDLGNRTIRSMERIRLSRSARGYMLKKTAQ